jgi:VWFA-related protein
MKTILAILFLCPLLGVTTFSQTKTKETEKEILKLSTDLVVVDTQVIKKKTATPVGNLKREDFSITEDGVLQEITHFSQDRLPLSILILLDTSGSVWDLINEVRDQAAESLKHLKESDEVALMGTASRTELIQDFTTDRKRIAEKIGSIDKKALGHRGILLHEAIYQAAKHLNRAANPASRRVVIVVTDNISTQMIGMGHSEKDALDELYETGVVVCGLKIKELDAMVLKFNPLYYGVKGFLFRGDIHGYAEKTGGVVRSTDKSQVENHLTELITTLRTRYAIGYISSNTRQDGKFRKIKLRLAPEVEKREGNPAIVARKGYFATKAKGQ